LRHLIERTRKGPAVWDMIVYVGEPGDSQDNPTLAWPETRKHFIAGTLTITQSTPQQKGMACEPINFDPLIMADGIAPTNNPVLLFRSPAYAVSYVKRLSVNEAQAKASCTRHGSCWVDATSESCSRGTTRLFDCLVETCKANGITLGVRLEFLDFRPASSQRWTAGGAIDNALRHDAASPVTLFRYQT
jgi:hypothetical protein